MKLPSSFLFNTGWPICIFLKKQNYYHICVTLTTSVLTIRPSNSPTMLLLPALLPPILGDTENEQCKDLYKNSSTPEEFYKQLEMYATFLSEGYNRLKYFYSDSPSQSKSVSSIIAVNLKNYSTPLGQEQWGHDLQKSPMWYYPVLLLSPRGIASSCTPSPPLSALSSSLTRGLSRDFP